MLTSDNEGRCARNINGKKDTVYRYTHTAAHRYYEGFAGRRQRRNALTKPIWSEWRKAVFVEEQLDRFCDSRRKRRITLQRSL